MVGIGRKVTPKVIRMTENKVRELMQKLEAEGDISIEEADELCATINSLSEFVLDTIEHEQELDNEKLYSLSSKRYPILALKDWYEAVAHKIEAGQSGNFICSLSFTYGSAGFSAYWSPAIKALREHGSLEDRVMSIQTNRKMYALFPKSFQDLFRWEDDDEIYILRSSHAGLFRHPLHKLEGSTISQLFEKLSIVPVMPPQDKFSVLSKTSATTYILAYLKRKVPFIQMDMTKSLSSETVAFTNKENLSIAKAAFSVSFEDLVENAVERNIINEKVARELLKHEGHLLRFPADKEFAEANLTYIDNVVRDMLKAKAEQQAALQAVENEREWLEATR